MNNGRKRNEAAYGIRNGGVRTASAGGLSGRASGRLLTGTKSRKAARVVHHTKVTFLFPDGAETIIYKRS